VAKIGKKTSSLIREEMSGLSGTAAKIKAEEIARKHKVSVKRIYAITSDLRYRKPRADKGFSRIDASLNDEQRAFLVKLSQEDILAEKIIEIGEESALLPKGLIKESMLTLWLRQNNVSRKELQTDNAYRPRFEAKYANQIWQVDYTTAQQFYIDDDGLVKKENAWSVNKNRKGNQKIRMHLFAAFDQYSRLCYYEFMRGCSTPYWLEFLFNAMTRKWDNYPFFGIPKIVATDNDSVVKSKLFTDAMHKLGIATWQHKPGASYSKGVVESGFRKIQAREAISKVKPMQTLEEWNQFAYDVMLKFGNEKHSAHKETPINAWLNSIRENPAHLRQAPTEELYDTLLYDEFTRLVANDLTISFNGIVFQLPRMSPFHEMINHKITFFIHRSKPDCIRIFWQDKYHDVAYEPRAAYAPGQTPEIQWEETKRSRLIAQAEAYQLPELKTHGKFVDKYKDVKYLTNLGAEFDASKIDGRLARTLDVETAIDMLRREGAFPEILEIRHREYVERYFAEHGEVTEYDIDALAKEIKEGRVGPLNMRLVVNE
jgi:hypothetical protein